MKGSTAAGVRRIPILGCGVDDLTLEETVAVVESFVASGRPHRHVCVNADKVVKASKDPALRETVNGCDLVSADGMPVVWASHALGTPLRERVTGIDLFAALMERAARRGWRVYLLGARREVLERVLAIYRERLPELVVAGHRDGYWKPEEEEGVAAAIRDAKPDLLFVAISSPRKERFLERWQPVMGVPFAMGVGGSFDVVAGVVKRAPRWMQRAGLEWLARFLQEPRRMFRRYFVHDMGFFVLLAREVAARRARRAIAFATVGAATLAWLQWTES
ncbi:MAG TPA: WecB/TagA/CpsF family glycosyltransferase [Usitatibacter sp.]|nr:WecB/TagA/CpsF family glycosyltransferase [Usitatibacter sp.]